MQDVPPTEENAEHPELSIPVWAVVLHHALVGLATVLPWVVQFTLNSWLAIIVWVALIALYDRLFVPKNSMCMGIPFIFPLASFTLLLAYDAFMLVRWLKHFA